MDMVYDAIFVITQHRETAKKIGLNLHQAIMQAKLSGITNHHFATFVTSAISDIRKILQNPNAPTLPDMVQQSVRRLFVGFDTEADAFLRQLYSNVNESDSLSQQMADSKTVIMPISKLVGQFCKDHRLTRLWVQRPIMGTYDDKLTTHLLEDGLEICCINPEVEKFADMAAVRAAVLYDLDHEAHKEVRQFWQTLREEFTHNKVQGALINNGFSALVEQRDPSDTTPEAVDLGKLYTQAILTWASGTY